MMSVQIPPQEHDFFSVQAVKAYGQFIENNY